jgi:hypothetical protein
LVLILFARGGIVAPERSLGAPSTVADLALLRIATGAAATSGWNGCDRGILDGSQSIAASAFP